MAQEASFLVIFGYTLVLAAFSWIGGIFSRMDGGGRPHVPEIVEKILCTFPYAIIGYLALSTAVFGFLVCLCAAIFSMGGAWLARATGIGQYFLDLKAKYIKPEKLDFILIPFFGLDPRTLYIDPYSISYKDAIEEYGHKKLFRRCVSGLAVRGLALTLAPAVALFSSGRFALSIAFFLSGGITAICYIVGHYLHGSTAGTEFAETWNGRVQFFFAGLVLLIILNVNAGY